MADLRRWIQAPDDELLYAVDGDDVPEMSAHDFKRAWDILHAPLQPARPLVVYEGWDLAQAWEDIDRPEEP